MEGKNVFALRILTATREMYSGNCKALIINEKDGQKEILANHENMVAPVEFGEMKITDADGKVIDAFIGDGFIEFFDNVANVVCISAELPENIDKRRAQEAKERAEEKLRQKQSIYEYNQSMADLSRAMERLKVKNRHEI